MPDSRSSTSAPAREPEDQPRESATRYVDLWVLLGCVVALIGLVVWAPASEPNQSASERRPVLGYLPHDVSFAASLDVERIRQSPLGAELFGEGRELPGIGRLADVCGNDPTMHITSLGVGVPARSAGEFEFGVVAIGEFDEGALASCAEKVIRRRGGSPVVTRVGGFLSVRDRGQPAGGEVAIKQHGPALLGGGAFMRELIDTADAHVKSALDNDMHRALRSAAGPERPIVASWLLSPNWLERASGSELSSLSPLSKVRAIALGAEVSPAVEVVVVLGCSDAAACHEVAALMRDLKTNQIGQLADETLGLPVSQRIVLSESERQIKLELTLSSLEAAKLLLRLFADFELSPSSPRPAPSLQPDELVRPPASGR